MTALTHGYLDQLEAFGPIAKSLSMCLRPTFCAEHEDSTLLWGDWSSIEARKLPWLADSRTARDVLDIFRAVDADPDAADIYMREAGNIHGIAPQEVLRRIKSGDKAAKGWRQEGKVACIAAGQRVRTENGLVPIEKVASNVRVWDGQALVAHGGVIYQGVKDVYEWGGVSATADHRVWTRTGRRATLGECIVHGWSLARTCDADAIRVGRADRPGAARDGAASPHTKPLHGLRRRTRARSGRVGVGAVQGLPDMLTAAPRAVMAIQAAGGGAITLHERERSGVGELRGAGGDFRFSVSGRSRALGDGAHGSGPEHGDRPHGQLQGLRAWEPALGVSYAKLPQQAGRRSAGGLGFPAVRMALRRSDRETEAARGVVARENNRAGARGRGAKAKMLACYRGKARVYDIVNCGPRSRFEVEGRIVHNCLSLGFGGGVGALLAMAAGYGLHFTEEQAERIVKLWRENNPWAKRFWNELTEAFNSAYHNPGVEYKAGRIHYIHDADHHGGTTFAVLPSGRILTYANLKWREVERENRDGETYMQTVMTYRKGYKWGSIWHGILSENVTQASAACVLRAKLREIATSDVPFVVRGHTHDEIICECKSVDLAEARDVLKEIMDRPLPWSDGLPLVSEISDHWYYTKAVE